MFEIAHVWAQAWENLFERVASCEEERLCVLASLCLSTTLHLLLYPHKRNTAECTQKPILLCGEATLSVKTTSQTPGEEQDIPALHTHECLPKRWSVQVRETHMNSWCLLILIMNIPKKALPWSVGDSFLLGTSEKPLALFTVPPKSTHSLPMGPDLHMKWYPSFSSTLAPLSAHMPGSEEAGKAHNWSVSLGWKSVTRVSPPRSTQEWLNIQIYWEM